VSVTPVQKFVQILFKRTDKRSPACERWCNLSVPCKQLDWQLSFTTQIFNQLSPLLSSTKLLTIDKPHLMSTGREDADPEQWLELFQSLPHLSEVCVNIEELVPDIVHALVNGGMAAGVLPSLTKLRLAGYRNSPSVIDAAEQFVSTRKITNRTILLHG
jgi:hypothetical protein